MRKLKLFAAVFIIAAIIVIAYRFDLNVKKESSRDVLNTATSQNGYEQVKNQVDDEAIIRKSLKAVGIMGVLEGREEYRQLIEAETWYSYRGININWHYRFSIAMDYNNLEVDISDGTVNITIDNKKLFIWFIEKTDDSTSRSEASWLAKKYSSQEIEVLEDAVKEKVKEKIINTTEYWEQARKSLEASLTKICNDLGYYNIKFI